MTTVRKCCSAVWKKKVHVKMTDIYHEKQVKELCALHALNNLFQNKVYDKNELDHICENLAPNSWINPHKSVLGLGNYDVNVILIALQSRGYEGIWFDKRKDPQNINFSNIVGFILNTPSDYKFCVVKIRLHKRHWIAIREIDGQYYNLDSKNNVPQQLGDEIKLGNEKVKEVDEFTYLRSKSTWDGRSKGSIKCRMSQEQKLIEFLRTELKNNDRELFIVVTQEVEKNQSWLLNPSDHEKSKRT